MRMSIRPLSSRTRPLTPAVVRRMRVFFVAVPSIISLVAVFFIVMGTREWMRAAESSSWPVVEGKILKSSLIESRHRSKGSTRTEYRPGVEFAYSMGGVERTGSKLSFRVSSWSRAAAQEYVDAHPVGSACSVSVSPDEAELAVLDPGADWLSAIPIAVGLFSLAFCGFFLWLVRKITRRMLAALGEPIGQPNEPKQPGMVPTDPRGDAVHHLSRSQDF
jgi:hypothetical protein